MFVSSSTSPAVRRLETLETDACASPSEWGDEFKQLLQVVAHDLRSPLVNARGLLAELRQDAGKLEVLKREGVLDLPSTEKEGVLSVIDRDIPDVLGYLDECVTRMDRVISRVAEFSNVALGDLEFEDVDLRALLEELVAAREAEMSERSCRAQIGEIPRAHGDPVALRRIFGELLDNAVKFMVPGRAGRISISGEVRDGRLRVIVSDNGRGIVKKDLERIFLPLRQCGSPVVGGQGMGLAVARALAQRHLGALTCSSVPAQGSSFILWMPLPTGWRG